MKRLWDYNPGGGGPIVKDRLWFHVAYKNQKNEYFPAGTPVTVRLQNSISSASANPGDAFEFTLVEPLVIDGRTVATAGSHGTGRVGSSGSTNRQRVPLSGTPMLPGFREPRSGFACVTGEVSVMP